jgi:hypothetical protein
MLLDDLNTWVYNNLNEVRKYIGTENVYHHHEINWKNYLASHENKDIRRTLIFGTNVLKLKDIHLSGAWFKYFTILYSVILFYSLNNDVEKSEVIKQVISDIYDNINKKMKPTDKIYKRDYISRTGGYVYFTKGGKKKSVTRKSHLSDIDFDIKCMPDYVRMIMDPGTLRQEKISKLLDDE